jgi:hypothetical protein
MKGVTLCLLLLSACSDPFGVRNYQTYKVTWTCVSPGGCQRAEEVAVIDRAEIFDNDSRVFFLSSHDGGFQEETQMVPSEDLPEGCFLLHGISFFVLDLPPSRFCRMSEAFELELSIPDRDPTTSSDWLVNGREIDP